jgi:hypothetical protein
MIEDQTLRQTKALLVCYFKPLKFAATMHPCQIGISYSQTGTWEALRGPHKDVRDMKAFLDGNSGAPIPFRTGLTSR